MSTVKSITTLALEAPNNNYYLLLVAAKNAVCAGDWATAASKLAFIADDDAGQWFDDVSATADAFYAKSKQ